MLNTNVNIRLELEIFPTVTDKHSNFLILDDGETRELSFSGCVRKTLVVMHE